MTLEQIEWKNNQQIVTYRPPLRQPRELVVLNLLLLLAATISTFNIVRLFQDFFPLFDITDALYIDIVQNRRPGIDPHLHDGVAILGDSIVFIVVTLALGTIYIPLRYVYIIFTSHWPHPRLFGMIMATAKFQMVMEALNVLFLVMVFDPKVLLVVRVTPNPGLNVLLAPVIMWWLHRPPLRRYFSRARIVRAKGSVMPERAHAPGTRIFMPWAKEGRTGETVWNIVGDPTLPGAGSDQPRRAKQPPARGTPPPKPPAAPPKRPPPS